GSYMLAASAEGYQKQVVYGIEAGAVDADFVLEPAPIVDGRVIDVKTGKPVARFDVGLAYESTPGTVDLGMVVFQSFSNLDGVFSFPVAHSGSYLTLLARAPGYTSNQLDLGRDMVNVSGLEIPLEPGQTQVVGSVRDPAGHGVPNAFIFLGTLPSPPSLGTPAARTDSVGEFTLENFPSQATLITAYDPDLGLGTALIEVKPNQTNQVEIILEPMAVVQGTVTYHGRPLPDAAILLQNEAGQALGGHTDENGAYEVRDVLPGKASVQASLPWGVDPTQTSRYLKQEVVVEAGQVAVLDFALPPSVSVTEEPQNQKTLVMGNVRSP
ncbi:MAG: carboxypeptidase regulatory-like domain-containing protein, partial [Candidatus Hydrogenedentes bacterium]|nr:carboxypeptidase regulatory-like domain-containing protein [Candidatus Hydrogenedentota bacterium]